MALTGALLTHTSAHLPVARPPASPCLHFPILEAALGSTLRNAPEEALDKATIPHPGESGDPETRAPVQEAWHVIERCHFPICKMGFSSGTVEGRGRGLPGSQ